MNSPVKNLKSRELMLVNKCFVDIPIKRMDYVRTESVAHSLCLPHAIQTKKAQALLLAWNQDHNITEDEILLNDITATTYKVSMCLQVTLYYRSTKCARQMNMA